MHQHIFMALLRTLAAADRSPTFDSNQDGVLSEQEFVTMGKAKS